MSQEPNSVRVNINLDAIVEVLKRGVRRTAGFLGLGVNAAMDPEFRNVQLPPSITNFSFFPSPVPEDSIDEIKREFKLWIEGCGLRELCESLEIYLTGIYECAKLSSLSDRGRIPSGATLEIPKNFTRKGIGTKLEMLRDEFGIAPRYPEHLRSFWDARNCLTHRRGVVGELDIDAATGSLTLKWLGMDTFLREPDGEERPLGINFEPFTAINGGVVMSRIVERVRVFSIGNRVELSPHDLTEICWTCLLQSDAMIVSMLAFFETRGIPFERVPAPLAPT